MKREGYVTFIDFCAGIGGGRLGLELNGLQCIGYSEIDKEAIQTYKKLHNAENEINFGDITQINPVLLPDFDLLIAGFPCQTFSIVGKREGLKNNREGQIIYYLANILNIKRPQYFILENVKGLINHNSGKTFNEILALLENAGYDVYFAVINSINFLPQSRERIYFIGIKHNTRIKYSSYELNNILF
ncbi:MAG: DNA (cytosine-5-)-methyltransferase, partial [Mucispirillum sp.]|nr:DNA (cytosine-5-)-methyltransferase [Mucispirillum sp.]